MWRVLIAETRTGVIMSEVQPRDLPSFTRKITDKGSWTVNVLPDDRHNAHVDLHAFTDVGRYSWVVAYGDHIVQAGPVVTYQYDNNPRNLSVSGTGIQGILDHRILWSKNVDPWEINTPAADVVLTDFTLGEIAQHIAYYGVIPAAEGYDLPIQGPQIGTGTHDRTYHGYDMATCWERLVELSEVVNGPELDFRPYFKPGQNTVAWDFVRGDPLIGNQTTDAVWDYGGALSMIDVDVNGSTSPCMRVWTKGSGTERETVFGFYEDMSLAALGFPPIDHVDSEHLSATKKATLESHAQSAQERFSAPIEKWTCSIRVDGDRAHSPALGTWSLGDAPQFGVSGHPWITDGVYRRRILGYSSKSDSEVDLELDTTLEVI